MSKGTSLIELLVSIACFSIIVVLATGIFINSLGSREKAKDLSRIQDEARYLMDFMSREIRMSEITHIDNNKIELNKSFYYKFNNNNFLRDNSILNTNNVKITGNFSGEKGNKNKQGFVEIYLKLEKHTSEFELRTTVSSRYYQDLYEE